LFDVNLGVFHGDVSYQLIPEKKRFPLPVVPYGILISVKTREDIIDNETIPYNCGLSLKKKTFASVALSVIQ
jgi:hypothetical protein